MYYSTVLKGAVKISYNLHS